MTRLSSAVSLFVHRLSGAGPLPQADIDAFCRLVGAAKPFLKDEPLIDQGERSSTIWIIDDGWCFRQKMLKDGRRQIVSLMLPGELTEKGPVLPFGSGDTVVAATSVLARPIDRRQFIDLLDASPELLRSLFFEELTRHAVSREWLLMLGRHRAPERLAYLLYEIYARLNAMGLVVGSSFDLPISQQDVADMIGLSSVHLNRTLQTLRARNLVIWTGHGVDLPDPPALARLAQFNEEFIRISQEFAARSGREGTSRPVAPGHTDAFGP